MGNLWCKTRFVYDNVYGLGLPNVPDFEYLNDMWQHEKEKEDGLLIQIQALGNDPINNLDIVDSIPLLLNPSKF